MPRQNLEPFFDMVEHADRNNLLKRAMAEYQSREASGARWDETEFFRRFASIEEARGQPAG